MNRIIKGDAGVQAAADTVVGKVPPAAAVSPLPSPSVVRAEVYDARAEARAIVDAATREAAATRAEGEHHGYEEGLARAAEVLHRAHAERDAILASSETEVLDLALHAAAKILGREIDEHGAAADIVSQALSAVRRAKAVRIRICPLDAEVVRAQEPALAQRLAQGAAFVLVEDAAITRGGCAIETESGRIDARLETQLAALRRAVFGDEGPGPSR